MKKIDQDILNLLYEGVNLETLREKTGLTSSDLALKLTALRNLGFNIGKKYLFNNVIFEILKSITNNKIIQINVKQKLRFLVISDTHYGSIHEKCEYGDEAFEYAYSNGIYYIIHGGDFTEGIRIGNQKNKNSIFESSLDEAYYFIEKFPSYGLIHILGILGNHDSRGFEEGFNLAKFIETHRPDITILGTGFGAIKTGEDHILIYHPKYRSNKKINREISDFSDLNKISPKLTLVGHIHEYDTRLVNDNRIIQLPSLSGFADNCGAIDITIEFAKVKDEKGIDRIEMYEINYIPLTFKNKLVGKDVLSHKVLHK